MEIMVSKPNPNKRSGSKDKTATRDRLLRAAEDLMRSEGYAAVTSRRLGDAAGVTPPLVHYYFASMDELFVCLYQQHAEAGLERVKQLLTQEDILQSLWMINSDPIDAVLHLEFMALGNHRKTVRAEMAKQGEVFRKLQHAALTKYLRAIGVKPLIDPELMIVLMASVGLLLSLEAQSGMDFGHKKARRYIEGLMASFNAEKATKK